MSETNKATDPLVSILLLSMNHEAYIEASVNSLLHQTYRNLEIIYLDNNSKDATFEIGEKMLQSGPFPFQAFKKTVSNGVSANLNFLLERSAGEYVIALSTDDWLSKNSVEEKVNYFKAHPGTGLVYSNSIYFFYDRGTGNVCQGKEKFRSGNVLNEVLRKDIYCTTGAMLDSGKLKELGGYDERSNIEDWDIWIRMAEKYPLGYIDQELAYYGIKTSSINISSNQNYMQAGYDYLFEKYKHYPQIQDAKAKAKRYKIYSLATNEPNLKTLKFVMANASFSLFWLRQLAKTVIGIIQNKNA